MIELRSSDISWDITVRSWGYFLRLVGATEMWWLVVTRAQCYYMSCQVFVLSISSQADTATSLFPTSTSHLTLNKVTNCLYFILLPHQTKTLSPEQIWSLILWTIVVNVSSFSSHVFCLYFLFVFLYKSPSTGRDSVVRCRVWPVMTDDTAALPVFYTFRQAAFTEKSMEGSMMNYVPRTHYLIFRKCFFNLSLVILNIYIDKS